MNEAAFLSALHDNPADEATWLALADWLEDDGQSARAELVRLVRRLRTVPLMRRTKERAALEDRVAELLRAGVLPPVPEVVNSFGMRLALIPPGRFRMGSPRGEPGRMDDEFAHEVQITQPFYLGVFPVTQAQFQQITRRTPSHFSKGGGGRERVAGMDTSDFPVERVQWGEAVSFCNRLSLRKDEKKANRHYRLPTEAEWEYACRGGSASTTAFHQGPQLTVHDANINSLPTDGDPPEDQPLRRTCEVGSYRPNAFGLYDMHGNVWEWCHDWHNDNHYRERAPVDPRGPAGGHGRVIRGGSWGARWPHTRAARRHSCSPNDRIYGFGFRVVMTVG
jgi:uncharacterized protein (TIGR02996 family)